MGDLSFNPAGRPELLSFGNVGRNTNTGAPASGYVPLAAGTLGSGDSLELTSLVVPQTGTTPENTDVRLVVNNAVANDPQGLTLNPSVRALLLAAPEQFPAA